MKTQGEVEAVVPEEEMADVRGCASLGGQAALLSVVDSDAEHQSDSESE